MRSWNLFIDKDYTALDAIMGGIIYKRKQPRGSLMVDDKFRNIGIASAQVIVKIGLGKQKRWVV